MTVTKRRLSRRTFIAASTAFGAAAGFGVPIPSAAAAGLAKPIPKSGERIPAVGMGTWLTFDVGGDTAGLARRARVLENFFAAGGGMIDSSPMYGSSEEVIGHALDWVRRKGGDTSTLFSATKIWTPIQWHGRQQMDLSEKYWGLKRFDLNQVHNLVNWESHLETLAAAKAEGRVRYIGVTTSHGNKHRALEHVMATQPIDFVQFTYNLVDRAAEARLLPLAADRGLAVIVNRPFRGGSLFTRFAARPLPGWAAEIGCANWAQVFLKFVISHPAVTCAIPATTNPDHMAENMGARLGAMPDAALRRRMAEDVTGV